MDNFRANMAEYVDGFVSESLNDRMKLYESITVQFSKFFSQDDLSFRLAQKVDNTTFEKLNELKASRDELNQAMAIIETLFDRLRHIALMQVEITRSMVPQKSSTSSSFEQTMTIQERQKKTEYLNKSAALMYNWITEFAV